MKHIIVTAFLSLISSLAFTQSKTVKLKVDSSEVYFEYFYKSKNFSKQILNDSIYIVGKKITPDKFYLDKFTNKRKSWTKIYKIELAKDSLNVTNRIIGVKGKHRFVYSKEVYYNGFLIENNNK